MAPNRRLKQARELRGWSQAKVAELIETDATTVSRWERGLFLPTPHFRERLCELFNKDAVELGLLEAIQFSHSQDTTESDSTHAQKDNGQSGKTETAERGEMVSLKSRSLLEGTDTFTYILQRSSQEQQAYMLWEHAYVQMLQNQHSEAQRLGQASVSVFEQVRHPNAAVVRAWLSQHGLLSTTPCPPDSSRPTEHKRPSQSWLRLGGVGVFVLLFLITGLLLSEIISNRSNLSTPAGIKYSPPLYETGHGSTPLPHSNTPTAVPPKSTPTTNTGNVLPTSVPSQSSVSATPQSHATPTNVPGTTPTPPPTPSIMPTVTPSHLNPHACFVDGSGYRCAINLTVYANPNAAISWQASADIPMAMNAVNGTVKAGKPSQVIVYINATCHQSGKIFFAFRDPASSQTITVSTLWGC